MAEAANLAQVGLNDKYNDLKQEHEALKNEAAQAKRALHQRDTDAVRFAEKNAAADQKIAELEAGMGKLEQAGATQFKELQNQLAASQDAAQGRENDLRDALSQSGDLREKLAKMAASEADLKLKIERLEKLLEDQRKTAGRSLQSRILELEAMLDAEQRRADELPEIPTVAMMKRKLASKAANSATVAESKASGS